MAYACTIQERTAQPTLTRRTTTPVKALPQVLGATYNEIIQYLGELRELPSGAPFVAYYNMDMESLDIEVGFPVSRPLPDRGDIKAGEIAAGLYATCLHTGPYDEVSPAYEALAQHVRESGYEAAGVAYEFYLNDPSETLPQDLLTEILFPLR